MPHLGYKTLVPHKQNKDRHPKTVYKDEIY